MEHHAFKLFNLYAHYPTVLLLVYTLTLFMPISASRILAFLLALAIVWGLWVHFDANLAYWTERFIDFRFFPDLGAPEGLEYMMREAFIYGFFTCFCLCSACILLAIPITAGSHVRTSIASQARIDTKNTTSPLL